MKVNFNRAALAQALGLLNSVVPPRTPKPILRCVLISAADKEVRICGTDLEAGINYIIPEVQVEQEGEVVVPADRLLAIVRESQDEILAMEAEEGACKIVGADSHFTIYGHDPKQFPKVPGFEGDGDLEVTIGKLQAAIEQVLFATAKESTRYALNGVMWEVEGKKLSLVATDGRRLAKCRINLKQAPSETFAETNLIIPAKTMSLLDKVGATDKESVFVKLIDNQISIKCGDVVISSNLVEGKFPKYQEIIPVDNDKKITLATDIALSAVRRASLLTSEESRGIKLSVNEDKLVLSSRAPETGDAEVDLQIDYKGKPIDIGFNPQYLIDVIRVINAPEFDILLGEPDRPGMIKVGQDFMYVLMPINLG